MSSYIHTLLTKLFGKTEYRLLIVGLDAAGKTTVLYKLKLGEVVTTIPTIGFNVETISYKKINFTFWDVGGRDKIRPLWRHYFQNTQGLIFVLDSNDKDRFEYASDDLWRLLQEDELRHIPVLIYMNKIDLPNAAKSEDVIKELRLNDIRNRSWFIQPCCACSGNGLYEGLDWLIHAIKSPTDFQYQQRSTIKENNEAENKSVEWLSQVDNDTNEEMIEKFAQHQLSIDKFDHRTLLRAIWCYLKLHSRKETIKDLFDHLPFYNKDMNETLLYFWIQIVHYACVATKNPTDDFPGFLLMNPQLLNESDLPLTYYKKETLFSNQAKISIVLPDLKPLPSILPSSTTANNQSSINELEDEEFLKQFESCTLTNWSHRTYLRMIWLYLTRDGRRIGKNKIFDGLKNFVQHSQSSQKTIFHFTIIYFWLQMIDLAIAQNSKDINFEEFLRLNHHLLNESLFLEYYTKETIFNNATAREQMVLPDIKPLPSLILSSNKK